MLRRVKCPHHAHDKNLKKTGLHNTRTLLYLEFLQLSLGDCVGFGNDRDDVHLCVQLLHAHQVDRFEAVTCKQIQDSQLGIAI